jgi:hypothetical protein
MASINAVFSNDYGESRRWVIVDSGRDPNSPPILFDDYLDPGQITQSLQLYSADGIYGQATYQRSDGAPTVADNVTNGATVSME